MMNISPTVREGLAAEGLPQAFPTIDVANQLRVDAETRFRLLRGMLERCGLRSTHFFHVPKTAGTTLAESLQADGKRAVVSVDAPFGVFIAHLCNAERTGAQRGLLTRSHHPHRVVAQSGLLGLCDQQLSGFRDPLGIHISNVSMIMKRMGMYYAGHDMDYSLRSFCIEWDRRIRDSGITFGQDRETALAILSSQSYLRMMGSIYSKFFAKCSDADLDRIHFFDFRKFDQLFIVHFGYEIAPPRRNEGEIKLITREDIAENLKRLLVADDADLVLRISARIEDPSVAADWARPGLLS